VRARWGVLHILLQLIANKHLVLCGGIEGVEKKDVEGFVWLDRRVVGKGAGRKLERWLGLGGRRGSGVLVEAMDDLRGLSFVTWKSEALSP
jgi:hypothetical protein